MLLLWLIGQVAQVAFENPFELMARFFPSGLKICEIGVKEFSECEFLARLSDGDRGINASIELIQATRGGDWPTGPVAEDSLSCSPLAKSKA